jgi:hypothetical protein
LNERVVERDVNRINVCRRHQTPADTGLVGTNRDLVVSTLQRDDCFKRTGDRPPLVDVLDEAGIVIDDAVSIEQNKVESRVGLHEDTIPARART